MKKIITSDVPCVALGSTNAFNFLDRFKLEKIYKISVDDFIIVDHRVDFIFLNKNLKNASEIKQLIIKIMGSKYMPDKLFNKFREYTNPEAENILLKIWINWRAAIRERDLHIEATKALKSAKSLRIHWLVKRNKDIINELYDIGFGIYEEGAVCDKQQGAENVFMYGYLLGAQANSH